MNHFCKKYLSVVSITHLNYQLIPECGYIQEIEPGTEFKKCQLIPECGFFQDIEPRTGFSKSY